MARIDPNRTVFVAALAVTIVLGCNCAYADRNSGLYVGGGAGQGQYLDFGQICQQVAPGAVTTCENKGVAWKGFAGYQFIRYFGVELGYYDFGKATVKTASGQADYRARGPYFGAVVTVPVFEHISLLARGGLIRWKTELGPSSGATFTGFSDAGVNGSYGLGIEYMFNEAFGVRAEWERFERIGNSQTTGESNINFYSASALFRF